MDWKPRQEDIVSLVQLLRDSQSPNSAVQMSVMKQLESFNTVPDYNNCLAYVFALTGPTPPSTPQPMVQVEPQVRMVAGLMLKNNVRSHLEDLSGSGIEFIKACTIHALSDVQDGIRSTAGTIITTFLSHGGIEKWPQVLEKLMELIQHPNHLVAEGAFGALVKVCEDSSTSLEANPSHPLQFMIPRFLEHFSNQSPKIREYAIACINQFLFIRSAALMAHFDAFLTALYQRASDESMSVKKSVCQAMVIVLEVEPHSLLPQLSNVVEFMLYCTQLEDPVVSLEACEFWLSFAEQDYLRDHLEPFLPRIIPVLLKCMVYTEEDIALLVGSNENDAAVPDAQQDMKPRHHKAKTHAFEGSAPLSSASSKSAAMGSDDADNEEDYDEEEEEDDEGYTEWNLRKCSAASLDVLSTTFESEILPILLPLLKDQLYHADWRVRECGILALGAVAEGAGPGIEQHLPVLIPMLISQLSDSHALVRSISCWTLSRFVLWIVRPRMPPGSTAEQYQAHLSTYFKPALESVLKVVLDDNKRVQEAACSSLATIEEEACSELVPYLLPILQTLCFAFSKYQQKNLLVLYDAVGTLADSVGNSLSDKVYIDLIMPPLIRKWDDLADDNRDIFALLECMSSVAAAFGPAFAPFAAVVWQRCMRIIQSCLVQLDAHTKNPAIEEPDKDFIIVSLDLMSGVIQGLGAGVSDLMTACSPLELLAICMKHESPQVRQSAYAVLGDMAVFTFQHIKPHLASLMPELISQITPVVDPTRTSVINNACWAGGEIAIKCGPDLQSWVEPMLARLIPLLLNQSVSRILHENTAIAIGRLGFVSPAMLSGHLGHVMKPWCASLRSIRDNSEKESAFIGMCHIVEYNPTVALPFFDVFCDAIAMWGRYSPELHATFQKILTMFKQMAGDQWSTHFANFPEGMRTKLMSTFAL